MSTTTRTARIACAAQHAELVGGVLEVAELAHEPLGVERPALGVTRRARQRALVAAQRVGEVAHLPDLQVMAGDALVVTDRHLAPQREACLAERRVPGAARAAEVLRRARVVHRRRATRRGDHRLDALHRLGDVEVHAVELGDGAVQQLLVPALERVDALDGARRVGLEVLDDGVDVGAGDDALRDLAHRALDAVQLVPPPRVGLVEVELDAVEVLRVQRVALAPHGVVLGRVRRVLLDEEPTERRRTPRSRASPASRGGRGTQGRRAPMRRTRRPG